MKNITSSVIIAALAMFCVACGKEVSPVTGTITPPTPVVTVDSLKIGLIAYYKFDNNTADSSGKGNNATNSRDISYAANRFGQANSAVAFNGLSSFISVKDNADLRLSNTDFTTNVWINMDSYNASYGSEVLCKRGTGSQNGWNYSINGNAISNGGKIGATSFQVSGGTDTLAAGTKPIALGQWHMLTTVYVVSKKQVSFYIDGVLDITSAIKVPVPSATASVDLYIGADSQSSDYLLAGKLDEVRIYGRAFTAAQVTKLYALAK